MWPIFDGAALRAPPTLYTLQAIYPFPFPFKPPYLAQHAILARSLIYTSDLSPRDIPIHWPSQTTPRSLIPGRCP